ncbi:MAG: hypothetical protein ABEJ68_05760 [Halobacteriaceae archaeon]
MSDAVGRGYAAWEVAVSAVAGLAVAVLAVWWANGFGVGFESLWRVSPTVEGGGVGTDWVAGNTIASLDALIFVTHLADVMMGLFIIFLFFLHWVSFRRLADRMRPPGAETATDGGEDVEGGESR